MTALTKLSSLMVGFWHITVMYSSGRRSALGGVEFRQPHPAFASVRLRRLADRRLATIPIICQRSRNGPDGLRAAGSAVKVFGPDLGLEAARKGFSDQRPDH